MKHRKRESILTFLLICAGCFVGAHLLEAEADTGDNDMGASGTVSWDVNLQATDQRYALADTIDKLIKSGSIPFTHGDGPQQINRVWWSRLTITSGANEEIDLTSLEDNFGNTIAFTDVKLVWVHIAEDLVGGSAYLQTVVANGWTNFVDDSLILPSGHGLWMAVCTDGWVVSSTKKLVRIVNSSSETITVDVAFAGVYIS